MTDNRLVIVTGGRTYAYPDVVRSRLNAIYVKHGGFTLFHGACLDKETGELTGADAYADEWGNSVPDVTVERFPADWDRWRRRAGPIRNRRMVKTGIQRFPREVIHGLAFPEPSSRGTVNCVMIMREFGIEPDVWDYTRVRTWQSRL